MIFPAPICVVVDLTKARDHRDPEIAATLRRKAGQDTVLVVIDDNGAATHVFRVWTEVEGGLDCNDRIGIFSGTEYLAIVALVAELRPDVAHDGQGIARIGETPRARRRRKARREDDRLRAPEGERYEDV